MSEERNTNNKISVSSKFLDLAAPLLLVVLWVVTVWAYVNLPESIPVHFNFKGDVDRYGDKNNLFLLSGIATVIYFGLTILPAKLRHFNFPDTTSQKNSEAQISFARKVFKMLRIVILIVFLELILVTCNASLNPAKGMGGWSYLLLAILILPTIYTIGKAFKIK